MCEIFDEIRREGEERGIKKGQIEGTVTTMREDGKSDQEIQKRLMKRYGLTKKKARKAVLLQYA